MSIKQNNLVQICVSTLNSGILNIEFNDHFSYLLVHQVTDAIDYSSIQSRLPCNVRYIRLDRKGLSFSRNIALQNCELPYCWIMDDDVKILDTASSSLNEMLENSPGYALYVVSHSEEIKDSKLKSTKKIGLLDTLHISSIDMVVDVKATKNISFNEDFGLGTDLPSGEEFIFSNRLLRSGLGVVKVDTICSIHPDLSSGDDFFSTVNKLKAKRLMFVEGTGRIYGFFLYFIFLIKKMPIIIRNRSTLNVFKSFR